MSQAGLVSIIIPCYNYGAYIADCIESLQAQTHEHWEAIVVDDGSTDDTPSRVAALVQEDVRIIYVSQKNQGVSAARNEGLARVRGEFVLFLDADDLLSANALHAHIKNFRRSPSVDISYSKFRYFSDNNRNEYFTNYRLDSQQEWSRPVQGNGEATFPVFIKKNNLPLQAAMFRSALLQRVGDFELNMRALEDWDYLLRCILRGACMARVDDPAASTLIRVHSSSATRNIAFADYQECVYENVRLEIARLRASGDVDEANFYDETLKEALLDQSRRRARRVSKARRKEIMQNIREAGISDFSRLYPVLKKYGFKFLYAYSRVFLEEVAKLFR